MARVSKRHPKHIKSLFGLINGFFNRIAQCRRHLQLRFGHVVTPWFELVD